MTQNTDTELHILFKTFVDGVNILRNTNKNNF